MRRVLLALVTIATTILVMSAASRGLAQDPPQATAAPITEREVRAVQQELFRRGILEHQPTGILDSDTRAALLAYQKKEGLTESGKIDEATVARLGLQFPLSDDGDRGNRRNGVLSKIGYAIKDETVAAGKAVGGAGRKVGRGAKAGAQKTVAVSEDAKNKTGETAKVAGDKSVAGAKTVGRSVQQKSTEVAVATVGRSDDKIHQDVRDLLNGDDKTRSLLSDVKEGRVTLTTETKSDADFSPVVSEIRKIAGVKSVTVINK